MEITLEQKAFLEAKLRKLSTSKFRSGFRLKEKDFLYLEKHDDSVLREHALALLERRLFCTHPFHDGKQTPMKGHPVFVAQHATATCCRGCLYKWHHIPKGRCLTEKEKRFVVELILYWIKKEKDSSKKL